MADSNTQPNVESIIEELRQGMDDITPVTSSTSGASELRQLQGDLRKANESSDVLGRCGGSLRGRLCLQMARFVLPIVEQLNAHHAAVVAALTKLSEQQSPSSHSESTSDGSVESRLAQLEAEIASLKAESRP
jgi:hypothetical protein